VTPCTTAFPASGHVFYSNVFLMLCNKLTRFSDSTNGTG